jgi:hypothetical protein
MGAVGIQSEDDDTPPQQDSSAPIELTIVRARQARARHPRRSPHTLGQPEPEAVTLRRVAAAQPAPQARPPRRGRKFWMAAAALFAVFSGATFTVLYLRQSAAERAEVAPEIVRAAIPVSSLHMHAEAQGDRVLVSWNPHAAGIQSATGGLLTIEDQSGTRTFPLDASQAANGSVLYRPASGDVTFRLQIQNMAGKVFRDSLRVLDPVRAEAPEASKPVSRAAVERPAQTNATGRPAPRAATAAQAHTPPAQMPTMAFRQAAPKPRASIDQQMPSSNWTSSRPLASVSEARPAPALPSAIQATSSSSSIPPPGEPASQLQQESPSTLQNTAPQPSTPSSLQTPAPAIGTTATGVQAQSIPLPGPPDGDFVPPQPTKQVLPTLRSSLASVLEPGTVVRVRVLVDSRGRVKRAETVGDLQNVDIGIQKAAVNAAKQWRFAPAKLNGKRVSSAHTIVFQFQSATR